MKGIITADWHLRKDVPRCRRESPEEWWETQKKAVLAIIAESQKRDCPIFHVGDLFHTSVVQEEIKTWLLTTLKGVSIYMLPGNHDLPYQSWDNVARSSWGILRNAGVAPIWDYPYEPVLAAPFGHDDEAGWRDGKNSTIRFTHQLVFPSEKDQPMPGIGKTAEELLKDFSEAQWIFTGDYHHAFEVIAGDRHVLNPGCITRQAADFKDYKPVCYYVDTEAEKVEVIELPDTAPVVTDDYLREEEVRNDRIEAFITSLRDQGEVTLNFLDNLRRKIQDPKMEKPVKDILLEIIEEIGGAP